MHVSPNTSRTVRIVSRPTGPDVAPEDGYHHGVLKEVDDAHKEGLFDGYA